MGRSSKKPCVGCGKEPERWTDEWTAEKPLCHECRRAIKEFKNAEKVIKRFVKKKKSAISIRVPEEKRSHDFPYLSNDGSPFDKDQSTRFQPAFLELVYALSEKSTEYASSATCLIGAQHDVHDEARVLEPAVIEPLRAVYRAAEGLAKRNYDEGFKRGSDMLQQLISGEIKNEDINERCKANKA